MLTNLAQNDVEGQKMTDNMNMLEQQYHEITDLYDYAEMLADTIDDEQVQDKQTQLELIEPLIEQMSESADVMSEAFIAIAEGKPFAKRRNKSKIEGALRKTYRAIEEYSVKIGHNIEAAEDVVYSVADSIVRKIKRQLEVIVANFVVMVNLSLDRIMNKQDIEELKQRQSQIALMLHAAGQSQGTGASA